MEVAVIGLGQFASSIAKEIENQGGTVLAIDINTKRVQAIAPYVTQTAILDGTDEQALQEMSIDHFDAVVIGMGDRALDRSLLCALALVNLGVKKIIAKASNESHEELLKKVGVTTTVNPEADMGSKIAAKLMKSSVIEYIYLSEDIKMESVLVEDDSKKIVDKTIQEINLRKKFNINIVCLKRGEDIIIAESDTVIRTGDTILIVGKTDYIDEFERKYGLRKVK